MEYSLDTEEGRRKAETLFSKQFIEYLTNKKLSAYNSGSYFSYNSNANNKSKETKHTVSSDEGSSTDSPRKFKKFKKKAKDRLTPNRSIDFNFKLRTRLTQCSLLKEAEEVTLPEELKTLLVNMTMLTQDIKESSSQYEGLYNLISKLTALVNEFIRRPLKKIQEDKKTEHTKNLEKYLQEIVGLVNEYKNGPGFDREGGIREYKKLEKEILQMNMQVSDLKNKILDQEIKLDRKIQDLNERVRNSVLFNEQLKSMIKFNQSHIKKCKKALVEKEWTKHKLESEVLNLNKKMSKADLSDPESWDMMSNITEMSMKDGERQKKGNSPRIKLMKQKKTKEKVK